MLECDWYSLYKADASFEKHLRETFPFQLPLSVERLMPEIFAGRLLGYVQCDFEVPGHLKTCSSKFPPLSKIPL